MSVLVHTCRVLVSESAVADDDRQASLTRYALLLLCIISCDDVDGHKSVEDGFQKLANKQGQPHYFKLINHLSASAGQ